MSLNKFSVARDIHPIAAVLCLPSCLPSPCARGIKATAGWGRPWPSRFVRLSLRGQRVRGQRFLGCYFLAPLGCGWSREPEQEAKKRSFSLTATLIKNDYLLSSLSAQVVTHLFNQFLSTYCYARQCYSCRGHRKNLHPPVTFKQHPQPWASLTLRCVPDL